MFPHRVTADALSEFLSDSGTTTATLSGNISPRFECAHKCLRARTAPDAMDNCNAFVYDGTDCKLGFVLPNWVMEQTLNPGDAGVIYFDSVFP